MKSRLRDRTEGGRLLAGQLMKFAHRPDVLVLALPRGGVPVAYEIATALGVPLDVFIVRKLGVPSQPELAMGAIATGGVRVLNEELLRHLPIPDEVIETVAAREQQELERRERAYRGHRPLPDVTGRTVILVDDGIATGTSLRAAVDALRQLQPAQIIVAVPVAPPSTCRKLQGQVDELFCLFTPEPFLSVGYWYEDFTPTTDEEVSDLIERAARQPDEGKAEAGA